jgi:hypothetical protein
MPQHVVPKHESFVSFAVKRCICSPATAMRRQEEQTIKNSTMSMRPTLGAKVAVILFAKLCDIRQHWQFSKKSSMHRWAKLHGRH